MVGAEETEDGGRAGAAFEEKTPADESEERLDTDFFVGMASYYLGEIAHQQYRALPVRLPEKQLERDLELKARMLLVTQGRFIDTIKVNNASAHASATSRMRSGSDRRRMMKNVARAVPMALKRYSEDRTQMGGRSPASTSRTVPPP